MILAHPTFERMISIGEEKIEVLVIENSGIFSKYVLELNSQICGDNGKFTLYKNSTEIPLSFVNLVINPFDLNPNSKNVLSILSSKLKSKLLDENYYQKTGELLHSIETHMLECLGDLDSYLLISDDINISDLVRITDFRFMLSNDSLLENICDYVRILREHVQTELFVFVNLKTFLGKEDLGLFYNFVLMNKIPILLLEYSCSDRIECENIRIIDADMCEIDDFTQGKLI